MFAYLLCSRRASSVRTVTGLIYVVIIALWVAVLIPMWLRRHDQVSEVRSTARFSTAMKLLGTPRTEAERRASSNASRPSRDQAGNRNSEPTLSQRTMSQRPVAQRPSHSPARQAAARRRALVLGTLVAVLAVVLLLAVVSVVPRIVPIVWALVVLGFVVATGLTASNRSASTPVARRTRAPQARPVAAPVAQAPADDWETWNAWDDDEQAWEAVPTTLPTYVSAPRASAIPRPIDRAHPGEWTGSAMVEAAQSMRREQVAFENVDHRAETAEIPVITAEYEVQRRTANG